MAIAMKEMSAPDIQMAARIVGVIVGIDELCTERPGGIRPQAYGSSELSSSALCAKPPCSLNKGWLAHHLARTRAQRLANSYKAALYSH